MSPTKTIDEVIVGDRFWLGRGQEMIKASVTATEAEAARIISAVSWLWTVYSGAGLFALLSTSISLSLIEALILTIPVVLLIVSYWAAARAVSPIYYHFDARVPSEIEAAHEESVDRKRRQIFVAHMFLSLSVISMCFSFVASTVLFNNANNTPVLRGLVSVNGEAYLYGMFPSHTDVLVVATGSKNVSKTKLLRSSSKGAITWSLIIPESYSYNIQATWKESVYHKTIGTTIRGNVP